MSGEARPILVVSRCLGFTACRWDGEMVRDDFVDSLSPHVRFITVCPEVEIGLGVPRDPIHIETDEEGRRLVQPASGRDVTESMLSFCASFLESLPQIEGFLLKSRSPSCGIGDVKTFHRGVGRSGAVTKGHGFFGGEVMRRFPLHPVESEGRLKDLRLREHFLVRVFTLARFRDAAGRGTLGSLADFHSRHKLLLMSYNRTELKGLERLSANRDRRHPEELLQLYGERLRKALVRPPRRASNIDVLLHSLGYISDKLSAKEKARFLESLRGYQEMVIPLSVPLGMMDSWIRRFGEKRLAEQVFFHPYPRDLIPRRRSDEERDS